MLWLAAALVFGVVAALGVMCSLATVPGRHYGEDGWSDSYDSTDSYSLFGSEADGSDSFGE